MSLASAAVQTVTADQYIEKVIWNKKQYDGSYNLSTAWM